MTRSMVSIAAGFFCIAVFAATSASAGTTGAHAQAPQIVTVTGLWGLKFRHFAYELTQDNVRLPGAIKGREKLDETAEQFLHGQFEVFIPARKIPLGTGCKGHYILRMAQTLDLRNAGEIKKKQDVFRQIREMAQGKRGPLPVVIEIDSYSACNLYFRMGKDSAYVDYVGPLRH